MQSRNKAASALHTSPCLPVTLLGVKKEPEHYRLFPLGFSARYLRVPEAWLRTECESNRLPHLRAGDAILVDLNRVERLLWQRAQTTTAAAPQDAEGRA